VADQRLQTPQAMRASVTDRLRALTVADRRLQLTDLLRQFSYDRLLARVFSGDDADRWVLKGATALLARLGPDTRHTRDVDLYREVGDLVEAETALRDAAARDLGDFFRFEVLPGSPPGPGSDTRTVRVTAYLGTTELASFPVDLVTHLSMTEEPDLMGPLVAVEVPGVISVPYRVYPVVDHIADKVCAIHELHPLVDGEPGPSTRYRDLVDLTTFARTTSVEAPALMRAVQTEALRRDLTLPDRVTLPERGDWRAGYAREVRNAPAVVDRDLDAAAVLAGRFLDPILSGTAKGTWQPDALAWSS
jgi:Nucleotidyl transferase AbiEii toxin, Type IV TA system